MPALFREGQEAEAENFVLYASMPFYMISKLKIPDRQDEGVQFLSSTFKVPLKLAKRKLEQIQRRELQGILILETARRLLTNHAIEETQASLGETTFYAYYDPAGDYIEPSQIIIQVDKETLVSQEELLFDLGGPFERIEENELQYFSDSIPVKFHDLDYTSDGRISLRLSHLASRYYNSAYKFIVHRKDIDQILNFHGALF